MTRHCPNGDFRTEDDSITECPNDYSPLVAVAVSLLHLTFEDGKALEIAQGTEVRLGRDREWSPHAAWLSAFGRVSRRHATVGLRASGRPYVTPEPDTTNPTFLNGVPLESSESTTFESGCTLGLSRQLSAHVTVSTTGPTT